MIKLLKTETERNSKLSTTQLIGLHIQKEVERIKYSVQNDQFKQKYV